ncbi:RNA polymerase sigma-70 factor (ECF subfamily) [Prosthecobacter fusiformis]|uniref:RNA polymerase sigma-70 factor (ECF subfamily) n=1 Tax=Prosthecobacter fusiformis TaxID=48464 RepID=A0A4R7RSN9_9BACT|nr:RNA polymerase sigma factor [Prosthecobacter fusiformis]TDU68149.1 RNA polymerase sigma-70 factor (ECF subfamily) [Prosthecobacter fusiformis]
MDRELADNLEALHPDAFGWALHCCGGDASRAEEVLQNAYLKIVQGRLHHAGASSFRTWWFGVIRLTAHEEFRRLCYRESLLGKLWMQLTGDARDPRPSPSHQAELDEQTLQLRAALAQLPARQAEVLHLVFYQDLTLSEAAAVMKVSVGSVRQHYERGKARLRSLLQPSSDHES